MGLTVVTSSLPIALELGNEPGIRVIATGGTVRAGELSLTGGFAEDALRRVNVDVAVLGVAGVDSVVGFTDYNPEDTRVKRLAIESARRVIVVADASKIGKVAFSAVADLSEVDILVTDTRTSPAEMKRLAAQDIEVVIAGANQPR
jgi:DeoR family fructose operon transcriptional repressor